MSYPSQEGFIKLAKKGNLIPVCKEIKIGEETPVSAFRKIEGEYSFLLESVEGEEKIARFSFLGTVPEKKLYSFRSFAEIRKAISRFNPVDVPGLPRFHGGLVGCVSYDMVREVENIPDRNPDELKIPPMLFLFTETLLAFDHIKGRIMIISNAEAEKDMTKAYDKACERIDEIEAKLRKPLQLKKESSGKEQRLEFTSNLTQKEFEAIVAKAKEYIRAGDIIQVVPSQRLRVDCRVDPFDVYRVLRSINPSPYMFYLKLGGVKIAGSSPEVMVRPAAPPPNTPMS